MADFPGNQSKNNIFQGSGLGSARGRMPIESWPVQNVIRPQSPSRLLPIGPRLQLRAPPGPPLAWPQTCDVACLQPGPPNTSEQIQGPPGKCKNTQRRGKFVQDHPEIAKKRKYAENTCRTSRETQKSYPEIHRKCTLDHPANTNIVHVGPPGNYKMKSGPDANKYVFDHPENTKGNTSEIRRKYCFETFALGGPTTGGTSGPRMCG